MKLEGELSFFPSKNGLVPESELPEFNDKEQNSAGYKLQNQKVKEHDNQVPTYLKENELVLDPSPYVKESADRMTTPKHDFRNRVIDLKYDYEAQLLELVEPLSHSSKDMESFVKFPNEKEVVKKSPASPISNPLGEMDSRENSGDDYMDKTVTEYEPERVVCCKESNYHAVKDICVDEGVLHKHKVMFENSTDEKAYNFFPLGSFEKIEKQKDNTGIDVLNLPETEESNQVSVNHDQSKDLMHKDEHVTENPIGNVNKQMVLPENKVLLLELGVQDYIPSDDKGEQVSSEPELHPESRESKNMVGETDMGSLSMVLAANESNSDSIILVNESSTYQFDSSAPEDCGRKEYHQVGETEHTSIPVEADDQAVTAEIRHSLGESSFSAVGPVPSHISYSGSIPYSGSISLRSDSSTTSTRSFAFPVLQSEWNSSPVRMAKAERSRYRKHRGWRQSLLCCEPELHPESRESKNMVGEAVNESNSDIIILVNESSTYQFDSSAPEDSDRKECHQVGETQHTPMSVEADEQAVTTEIRHSLGESSFSAVDPVPSHISYSGSIPYSGSISLRSDSSTTSTRSFAFPILQSEWNSSPDRMAKADRRRYRKHRGWRQSLLCCKF